MSAAFKVFLLIVLLFGACWAYQFRARDLREWLEPGLHAPVERDDLPGLFSPVERVLDPGETGFSRSSPPEAAGARFLASLRYEPPPPPPRTPEQVLLDPPESPATRTEASPRRHPEGHQEGHPAPRAQEIAPAAPADRRVADPEEGPPVEIVLFRKPPPGAPSAREPKKEAQKLAEKGPAEKGTEKIAEKIAAKIEKLEKPKALKGEKAEKILAKKAATEGEEEKRAAPAGRAATEKAPEKALADRPPPSPSPAEEEPAQARTRPRLVSHVVGPKETLASLARRYYGNETEKWKAIYAANQERLDDPHSLPLGLVLEIPDAISNLQAEAPGGARSPAPGRREAVVRAANGKVQRGRTPSKTRGVNS